MMSPPTTTVPPTSLPPTTTSLPAPIDWWASPDFWTIVAGVAAVLIPAVGVAVWAVRVLRRRSAQQPGVRRRLLGRRGPMIRNDWPTLSPRFTGRTDLLSQLRRQLPKGRPVVLHGLGGVGKTQTVLAYLDHHQRAYQVIWWVRAEQSATLTQDLARLAGPLGLPERADPDQTVVVGAVRRWLTGHRGWLLVLDNATTEHALADVLPSQPLRGQVLLTSRNPMWPDATPVYVHPWTTTESLAFLHSSMPAAQRTDEAGMAALALELGHLPIALEQASAYLHAAPRPLGEYLELLRLEPGRWLDTRGLADDERTVAKTWAAALDELRRTKGAEELLTLCAFLAPDDIPQELLTEGQGALPEPLKAVAGDAGTLDQAVIALRRYSFVTLTDDTLGVHRLVQAVSRHRLSEDQAKTWAGSAVNLVAMFFPEKADEVRAWPDCELLLPHALAAAGHAARVKAEPVATSWLLDRAAVYLQSRARLAEAHEHAEHAVAIVEAAFGPDHRYVASARNDLGLILRDLGDLKGARVQIERALAIEEAALGPDHEMVALRRHNLGVVLQGLGDLKGAREQLERALATVEAALGPDHPTVATYQGNLGMVLESLGDLKGARVQLERALATDEAALGPDHEMVALRRHNLGVVLQGLGDLKGAREQLERALAIHDAALGPDHPRVAVSRANLGAVLLDLGDLDGARGQLERALAVIEAALGRDHPTVASARTNLGAVLLDLGDFNGARVQLERALAIHEATLDPDHPTVANARSNLAAVLQDLGDLDGARVQLERALEIDEAALGPDHPTVADHRSNLGVLLQDVGDLKGAREQHERALQVTEAALGPDHPAVANRRHNLGMALWGLGDLKGAREQLERALAIHEAALGRDHPRTQDIRTKLGGVRQALREGRP
jgi:tetratricopeptide (TPR) repeat protein